MPDTTLAPVADDEFDALIAAAERPVLVDFWAPWCGSCRLLAPAVASTARELEGRVDVVTMNTESDPAIAERLGVLSLPTLVLFRDGQEVSRLTGTRSARALLAAVEADLEA